MFEKFKRAYPKCFHYDPNAIFIYNLLNENYVKHCNSAQVKFLFSLYTILLCGLSSLQLNYLTRDKILHRFSRFINYDGISEWQFLRKVYELLLDKDIQYFETIMTLTDYKKFLHAHSLLKTNIIDQLSELL
jgi:hypothetical protein